MLKTLLSLATILACSAISFSQTHYATSSIYGTVLDMNTGKRTDFAESVLMNRDSTVAASATVENGKFEMDGLKEGEYILCILAVGYETYSTGSIRIGQDEKKNVGEIRLVPQENTLEGTMVTGSKSPVIYKIDKRKISGSSTLSAAGGTAVDVLKSIPSVTIDSDGEVSLRGSTGFLVYVDGKPSMLEGTQALNQIAASNIEDIEIMTSPSAKYRTDADAGIINIITKKIHGEGLGGSASVSGSTIGSWNGDILLNWRKGNHRFYAGSANSQIRGKSDFKQSKRTEVDDFKTLSEAEGLRHSNTASFIGKAGWEFGTNRHSALVEIQSGKTDKTTGGDMNYYENRKHGEVTVNDGTYDSNDRYSLMKKLAQIAGEYKYVINERGDFIAAHGRLRYDWFSREYTESNLFALDGERYGGTRGYEDEHHWDYDWDINYLVQYDEDGKFETGYQMTSYSEHGDYKIKYWIPEAEEFQWQTDMATPFFYRRQIHSLFAMVTDEIGAFSINAGLRGDYTHDISEIPAMPETNRNLTRIELFPSAAVAYNAPKGNTVSLSYARRTNRPGVWKLEPYITYEDYYTRLTGNPDIKPEYIHSAEAGYRKTFGENTVSVTGFYRNRTGKTDLIKVPYEPGVTLDSLINAGNDVTYGLEADARLKVSRWWDMSVTGSVFKYDFTSTFAGGTDASNLSYTLGMMNRFKIKDKTGIQFDVTAVGPTILSQGKENGYFYFDLAVNRSFLKDRFSVSLVFRDAFRTAHYVNRRETAGLMSATDIRPVYPDIRLALHYNFNFSDRKDRPARAISTGNVFEGKDF